MSSFEIPLPEITEENFTRAWTRFELVSAAKEWQADKQAAILPTLLRGKLVDLYVDFDDDTKKDLKKLKKTLMEKACRTCTRPTYSWKTVHDTQSKTS